MVNWPVLPIHIDGVAFLSPEVISAVTVIQCISDRVLAIVYIAMVSVLEVLFPIEPFDVLECDMCYKAAFFLGTSCALKAFIKP